MSGFNLGMLAFAGIAILLFALLSFVLLRQPARRGGGFEAPEARPPLPAGGGRAAVAPRPPYTAWRLMARSLANPDSAGGPLYRLRLEPEDALPAWQPGAVAHVYCGPSVEALSPGGGAAAPTGDYLVGSLPDDGAVELVVRLRPAHNPGEGLRSRWLCQEAQTGQQVALALRVEPDFAPPPEEVPLILIGNATGIAGLQAHIRARPQGTRNWLIFGDRNSADDQALAAEVAEWVSTGHLERCDLVFPGDAQEKRRVTDQLEDAAAPLLDWALADSAIYVCGSRLMGDDVQAALNRILGSEVLDALSAEGRYRRLVY